MISRERMDGVSKPACLRLLLWLAVGCAALISCSAQSGDYCTVGRFPPPLTYSNKNTSGLILSTAHPAPCSGCLASWEFCYIINPAGGSTAEDVSVTFALWREDGENMLREVEKSRFNTSLRVPGTEHRFTCEAWSMGGCGVEVKERDVLGVYVYPHSVSIDVVGEVEGEVVMVSNESGLKSGGRVNRSSLEEMDGVGLLIFVRVDPGFCNNTGMPDKVCSGSLTNPPAQRTSPEEPGGTDVWVLVVVPLLCVILLALLLVIPVFILARWTCYSPTRKNPLQAILLSASRKTTSLNHTNGRGAVDLGLLENAGSGSSHSTSLSPAPQGGAESLANGQCLVPHSRTVLPWQPPTREGQGDCSISHVESVKSRSSSKRNPPPVKPKPKHYSSQKETHPPSVDAASSAELTNSEKTVSSKSPPPSSVNSSPLPLPTVDAPPARPSVSITTPLEEGPTGAPHAALAPPTIHGLRRSRSVEAFFLPLDLTGRPSGEKGNVCFSSSPWHRASHTATGSLPELATPTAFLGSPAVDEDDYTIPTHMLTFPRRSPQPYLQPQALYSYAYSHTMRTLATKYQTFPHGTTKPAPTVKERSQSDTSNPYESIRSQPRLKSMREGEEPDYDEIFSDIDVQSPEPRGPELRGPDLRGPDLRGAESRGPEPRGLSPSTSMKNTPTSPAQTTPTSSAHATPTPTARAPLTSATRDYPEKQKSSEPSILYQRRPVHIPASPGPAQSLAPRSTTSPGQRMKLRSIFSSPISHTPPAPLTAPQRHSSTTSEGYVNDDEFPRPSMPPCYPTPPPSATLPPSQPTLQRYTKLHSHMMVEDATYDIPQGSNQDLATLVSPAEQDYDHLEEGGNYDRLESSSSSSSHH